MGRCRKLRWVLWVGCALTALGGCVATGRPGAGVHGRFGSAWADTLDEAQDLAGMLDRHLASVRGLLPDTREIRPEVWLVSEANLQGGFQKLAMLGVDGASTPRRIWLRRPLARPIDSLLVHELVHHVLGPSWAPLPPFVQEGLVEYVALRVLPFDDILRAKHRVWAAVYLGPDRASVELTAKHAEGEVRKRFGVREPPGAAIDPSTLLATDRATFWRHLDMGHGFTLSAGYAIGQLVVSRIVERRGFEGLHALCLRATADGLEEIPVSWLLHAADLTPEAEAWREVCLPELTSSDLAAWARAEAILVLYEVRDHWTVLSMYGFRLEDVQQWRDRMTLKVVMEGPGLEVDLMDIPEIREQLLASLDRDTRGWLSLKPATGNRRPTPSDSGPGGP